MQALSKLSLNYLEEWCLAMLKWHVRSLKVIARQTIVIIIVVFHCRVWSHWCGVHNQWPCFQPNQQVCIGELYHCWRWCAGVWWALHCRVWFWPWDYKWRVECRKGRTQHRRHPDQRWWLWVVPKRVGAIVLVCIYTIIQIRYCLLSILFPLQLFWSTSMKIATLLLKVMAKSVSPYALMDSSLFLCGLLLKSVKGQLLVGCACHWVCNCYI